MAAPGLGSRRFSPQCAVHMCAAVELLWSRMAPQQPTVVPPVQEHRDARANARHVCRALAQLSHVSRPLRLIPCPYTSKVSRVGRRIRPRRDRIPRLDAHKQDGTRPDTLSLSSPILLRWGCEWSFPVCSGCVKFSVTAAARASSRQQDRLLAAREGQVHSHRQDRARARKPRHE
jgi:hypothetical protein